MMSNEKKSKQSHFSKIEFHFTEGWTRISKVFLDLALSVI